MKKEIIFASIFLIVLAVTFHFSIQYPAAHELSVVSKQLEKERSFNARRRRRLRFMQKPEKINLDGVALAYHLTGIKPSVDAAILFCENGPENLESGSIDKTDFFTQFPIEQRSGLEGGRTLNRMAWEWFTTTDEGRRAMRQFFHHAAASYTAMGKAEQNSWTDNLMIAEKRFSKDIAWVNKVEEKSLNLTVPTPTPEPQLMGAGQ